MALKNLISSQLHKTCSWPFGVCDMCVFECQSVVNFKRGDAVGSKYEFREGSQSSPRLLQMLIVFHCGSVPIVDAVVASVSFYPAHVSADPTVAVRVTLD